MAVEAIAKEMKYEQLLEGEQKQKHKEQNEALTIKLESLRNKHECIGNQAELEQRRQAEEQKKNSIANQVNQIKCQIKNMILKNRENKKQELEKLNKANEKTKKGLQKDIEEERMKLAADVMQAHKKGDESKCLSQNKDQQCQYCQNNFS